MNALKNKQHSVLPNNCNDKKLLLKKSTWQIVLQRKEEFTATRNVCVKFDKQVQSWAIPSNLK